MNPVGSKSLQYPLAHADCLIASISIKKGTVMRAQEVDRGLENPAMDVWSDLGKLV